MLAATVNPSLHALAAGILGSFTLAATGGISLADTLPVTKCTDDGSAGTLRSVVATAHEFDTIDLHSQLECSVITLSQGQIVIPKNLELVGPNDRTVSIVGDGYDRVLQSEDYTYLAISYLTISGGRVGNSLSNGFAYSGGCILAKGWVALNHSTVSDCEVHSYDAIGGAISATAVRLTNATLITHNYAIGEGYFPSAKGGGVGSSYFYCVDSTVEGNAAGTGAIGYSFGGGVVADNALLYRCTIAFNHGGGGGGLTALSATVLESTITGNNGRPRWGGGILAMTSSIYGSTVAFNYGGGISTFSYRDPRYDSQIIAWGSIIANNGNSNIKNDLEVGDGVTLTGANNLVMSISGNVTPPPNFVVESNDPQLTPLAFHGGLTRVHALQPTSPAIDKGSNPLADETDQRGAGYAREVPTGQPDIGAYERQVDDDEVFYGGFGGFYISLFAPKQ